MTPDTTAQGTGGDDRAGRLTGPQRPAGLRPPLTPAQAAARRRAGQELFEKYAGRYVAYLDDWSGDSLDRLVLFVAETAQEFHDRLRALDPHVLKRVEVTLLPDADTFEAPSIELV